MNWRAQPGYAEKTARLAQGFRVPFEMFLDNLDLAGIPFALGDTVRDRDREWEVWKIGRHCPVGEDSSDPHAWTVYAPKLVVTQVPPGSGKGPHPFGLAGDVYPLNGHALMSQDHPNWTGTITTMWGIAEMCGIDALGHPRPDRPGDEYASFDPCHFQALNYRTLLPPITREA